MKVQMETFTSNISASNKETFVDLTLPEEAIDRRRAAGANDKRARSLSDWEALRPHIPSSAPNNQHADTIRTTRVHSEAYELEECAQGRHLRHSGHDPTNKTAKNDAGDMQKHTAAPKRHTPRATDYIPLAELERLDSPEIPATNDEEILVIADAEDEDVPEVVKATRIKPNEGRKVEKQVVKANPSPEDLDIPKKEIDAPASFHAHNQKTSKDIRREEREKQKRKTQEALERYKDDSKHSGPPGHYWTYPSASVAARDEVPIPLTRPKAPLPAPDEADDMRINIGGAKPHNGLALPPPRNPAYKSQKSGALTVKPFDLTSEDARNAGQGQPTKRRRIEGAVSNGSSTAPISIDESPRMQRQSGPSSARSLTSQSCNGTGRNTSFGVDGGVSEMRRVESYTKGRKPRNRGSADGAKGPTIIRGNQRLPGQKPDTQMFGEDPKDPIIDSLDYDDDLVEVDKPSHSTRKSVLTVEIDTRPQQENGTGYRGNAGLRPSRTEQAMREAKLPRKRHASENTSRYFSNGQSQRRDSNVSVPRTAKEHSTANSSRNTRQKQAPTSEASEGDELAQEPDDPKEVKQFAEAQGLLDTYRKDKKLTARSNGPQKPRQAYEADDLSDDGDELGNRADIHPGKYVSAKAKSQSKARDKRYNVLQVFSEARVWLPLENKSSWLLTHHETAKSLSFFDELGDSRVEFLTQDIERIEICETETSSKMVLHKSRNKSAEGATKIYLELEHVDGAFELFESIRSLRSTVGKVPKSEEHLEKVFAHVPKGITDRSKRRRRMVQDEPDDIRLAKANEAKRLEATWNDKQSHKKLNGTASESNQRVQYAEIESRRAQGVAKAMLVSDVTDEVFDVDFPASRTNEVDPQDFYGSSPRNTRSSRTTIAGTRSSARDADVQHTPPSKWHSPRRRSPSPLGWTVSHPGWDDEWESSVIYPREGKSKATVDRQDIERLDEGEFLNDNLIIFYLRWLEDRLEKQHEDISKRIYFHNTFFYERLTKGTKGKAGGINYDAVKRWTSKVDLLQYDYIVVPVNEAAHWYVAIICNAPKLLVDTAEENSSSQSQPKADEAEIDQPAEGFASKSSPSLPTEAVDSTGDGVDVEMKGMSLDDQEGVSNGLDPDKHQPPSPHATALSEAEKSDHGSMDMTGPPPSNIVSDLLADTVLDLLTPKASQAKKSRRRPAPAPRRYNPAEPRIITLDSLGLTHSPTCTNLKKYLLQEIKAKKNIEVDDPGQLGTTAKDIPQQDNHCDCGLFLLMYVEEFLKKPDEFVEGLLLRNHADLVTKWPKASDMRNDIRNLLFDLQKQQIAENGSAKKKKGKGKGKGKQAATAQGNPPASSIPTSREASKVARNSALLDTARSTPEPSDQLEVKASSETAESAGNTDAISSKSQPARPNTDEAGEGETITNATKAMFNIPASQDTDPTVAEATGQQTFPREVINVDDSTQETDMMGGDIQDVLRVSTPPLRASSKKNPGREDAPQLPSASGDPEEILDSQETTYRKHPLPNSSVQGGPSSRTSNSNSEPDTAPRRKAGRHPELPSAKRIRKSSTENSDPMWDGIDDGARASATDGDNEVVMVRAGSTPPSATAGSHDEEQDEMLLSHETTLFPIPGPLSSPRFDQSSPVQQHTTQGYALSSPPRKLSHVEANGQTGPPSSRKRKTVVNISDDDHPVKLRNIPKAPKTPEAQRLDSSDAAIIGVRRNTPRTSR